MRIALAQRNLDRGYEFLKEVSHPDSPRYGQHWSHEDLVSTFSAGAESISAVRLWLTSSGIADERIMVSAGMNWLHLDATVTEAERLLQTQYRFYKHTETSQMQIACREYSIPAHLRQHIDFVTPTVHFDAKAVKSKQRSEITKRQSSQNSKEAGVARSIGMPGSGSLPKPGKIIGESGLILQETSVAFCSVLITPDCLRMLYGFGPNNASAPNNSYGIVEYTPQALVQKDLDQFFTIFQPDAAGKSPIFAPIDGGVIQTNQTGFDFNGESNLDLEYAMALVSPQPVTLYQTGDTVMGASFNNLLDAFDQTYCGGDDPTQDGVYPDQMPGGFQGTSCGNYTPAFVISTSYSTNEMDVTPAYAQRQCNEYMKLGLMGTTIIYSSGDFGVAGNGDTCISGNGTYIDGAQGGRFNPSFPGTCPYITAVGATQVKNTTMLSSSPTQPEMACESVIFSGGGFSNVFQMPSYQSQAVPQYFEGSAAPQFSAQQFNNSRQARGFPDVSANGANYGIILNGTLQMSFGTSASAPTFGSIITMINQERIKVGKRPVGFINEALYANPGIMNDITEGSNPGCNTTGFQAAKGWDPVTGLGTPNYPKMLEYFMSLK
ncbi:MAG: hypothetical protein Q9165_001554 [Trypethelium subeluteriae]